jgi:putative oxidoreductase
VPPFFRKFSYRRFVPSKADLGGWVLRGGVAVFFFMAGKEKFPTVHNQWVEIFQRIGFGQWFRYFTGWVEIVGGVLYLLPWTCPIGAALLACTMIGAMATDIFVLHSVGASIIPALLLFAVIAIASRTPDEPFNAASRRMFSRRS